MRKKVGQSDRTHKDPEGLAPKANSSLSNKPTVGTALGRHPPGQLYITPEERLRRVAYLLLKAMYLCDEFDREQGDPRD
jgi:hypothetical protein